MGERLGNSFASVYAGWIADCQEPFANCTANNGNYYLWAASRDGDLRLAQYSVQCGANVRAYGDECVRVASKRGHASVVRFLVERGADVRAHDDECVRVASMCGHLPIVRLLVEECGADVRVCADACVREASRGGTRRSCGT